MFVRDKINQREKRWTTYFALHNFNVVLKKLTMSQKNINPFDLNRTEYAELLGITPNAVRMRLRKGKLEGEYIFENGKYLFRAPSRERDYIVKPGGLETTPKKVYNRGNHYKANYPNDAFRRHNEEKMLRKLNETDPNFIKDYKQIKAKYVQEKAVEKVERMKNMSIVKDYGGGIFNESNKGYLDPQYHNGRADQYHPNKFRGSKYTKPKEKKYYW